MKPSKQYPFTLLKVGGRDLLAERIGPVAAELLRARKHVMTMRRVDLHLLGTVLAG